ncbi:MAG: type II toxin-antitoxin system PemK/MazF family toxin [Parcubacteria group bacterium]|nr:type II toxin-antitoxin system PemK/MazF family toxin [Parcubacteria group bacterium]
MDFHQGDIALANLNPTRGHEQAGFRPVLIMQANILNKHLSTVIIAPITTNLGAQGKLTTYLLAKDASGLDYDSVVLVHQIRALDKQRLEKKIASIPRDEFQKIREKLLFVFG